MMTFEHAQTVLSLCMHGILHLERYDAEERSTLSQLLDGEGLRAVSSCTDPVQFDQFAEHKLRLTQGRGVVWAASALPAGEDAARSRGTCRVADGRSQGSD